MYVCMCILSYRLAIYYITCDLKWNSNKMLIHTEMDNHVADDVKWLIYPTCITILFLSHIKIK